MAVPDDATADPAPSAFDQMALIESEIESVERHVAQLTELISDLRRAKGAWRAGGQAEGRIIRVLVGMDDVGWHVLPDRRWPGTRRANIDALLIGPGGVFVIDVKNWSRDVRVERGRLWRGDVDVGDELDKLLSQTAAVENVVVETGLPPTEVVPLLVLAGRKDIAAQVDRVLLLGEQDLVGELVRRGVRLAPEQVQPLIAVLERECPPMARWTRPSPPTRAVVSSTHTTPLMSTRELWQAVEEAAALEPIESWMTWLHPLQARLVSRTFSGPSRIRGGAGTGKTVLALHRAKHLAAHGRRVLFTSFLNTLAPVNRALFARLGPAQRDRVEFTSVHAVAARWVRERGNDQRIDQELAATCFARAWASTRHDPVLAQLIPTPGYWKEEIATVIKGRGLTSLEQYSQLSRVGRRTPLAATHRAAVWRLYERYEELLRARGVGDVDDMLLIARDLARQALRNGDDTAFDAVIVDEVQDLTCVGLQFLHALVGDRPDGLMIVGDGQQSVYPGGFTLSEAGVSVVGRSTVLNRNYRNGELILRYALAVVADDQFDDLEAEPVAGVRRIEPGRPGGEVIQIAGDSHSQEQAMSSLLHDLHRERDVRYGDMAVLVPTNAVAAQWQGRLARNNVPSILLRNYDGIPCEQVKVGTFHRAKGLEFAYVFIPDRDLYPAPRRPFETEDAFRERAELERRLLFVAMTRARDGLWLGTRDRILRP